MCFSPFVCSLFDFYSFVVLTRTVTNREVTYKIRSQHSGVEGSWQRSHAKNLSRSWQWFVSISVGHPQAFHPIKSLGKPILKAIFLLEKANFKNRPTLGQPNLKIKKKSKIFGISTIFGQKKTTDFSIFGKKDNE